MNLYGSRCFHGTLRRFNVIEEQNPRWLEVTSVNPNMEYLCIRYYKLYANFIFILEYINILGIVPCVSVYTKQKILRNVYQLAFNRNLHFIIPLGRNFAVLIHCLRIRKLFGYLNGIVILSIKGDIPEIAVLADS